ncbi:lasso peptide biosynthesis B2 protein [Spirosoma sp. KCTC 42546]|uniref:lasso peptide biosynthesis B2 protein n=1 Tax=Spirosoma sp. KCTC 42546 TaxID=2520506 RepID=UPI001157C3FC|nr:lasso peptide biosynthesis B2 protein [Spirosoma sp. KCTC 42546]QDK82932.1 lasso peptide biosynthesis B2 protein [Spirosoma sp. KCTC 42546]
MKNWWKRFNEFARLPIADQRLITQTFTVVVLIRIGLKFLSFQQFRTVYSKVTAAKKYNNTVDQLIERRVWAIQKVSGTLSAVCLPQALALTYFLRTEKDVELIVGVQKSHTFEAHAWVEKNGTILIGQSPDSSFQPIWVWQ